MYPLGLSAIERNLYLEHLTSSHTVNFRVQILDLNHVPVDNISHAVVDGQINVNWEADIATRDLSLALLDPDFALGFDTSQVIDGAWFYDRMIQVSAEVFVPALNRVITCPLFTGPVRQVSRRGATVTVKCVGKDVFTRQSWPRFTVFRGTNVIGAIETVLRELGDTFFRIEATTEAVLSSDMVFDRNSQITPWGDCRLLAASAGCRLFYAGDGYATIRSKQDDGPPVLTFRDGTGGAVLSRPETTGDYSRLANVVRAEGMPVSGPPPSAEVMVPTSSRIHPSKLLRGGKPMYMGVLIQRDSITTESQAKSVATYELQDRQFAVYDFAFDALPIFPLEEGDVIGIQTNEFSMSAPALKFSFGLTPKAPMTVGYKKLIAPAVARITKGFVG